MQGAKVKDNYNQEACQRQLPGKDKTEVKDLQTGNYAGMVCKAHSRCCIVQMKTFTKGFPAMQSIGWEKGEPKPQRRCRKSKNFKVTAAVKMISKTVLNIQFTQIIQEVITCIQIKALICQINQIIS